MGQGSLFGGWEACEITVKLHVGLEQRTGWATVETVGETGQVLSRNRVIWKKPRDLAGWPDVVKEVATAFLYGTPEDVSAMLSSAVRVHLPEIPAHVS